MVFIQFYSRTAWLVKTMHGGGFDKYCYCLHLNLECLDIEHETKYLYFLRHITMLQCTFVQRNCQYFIFLLYRVEKQHQYSFMVRHCSVGRAPACCKAGPSSILGSAPQGGFPTELTSDEDMDRPRRMATDKCIVWMGLNECMYIVKYKKKYSHRKAAHLYSIRWWCVGTM